MSVPSQKSEQSCISLLVVSILPLFCHFGIIPTVWCFSFYCFQKLILFTPGYWPVWTCLICRQYLFILMNVLAIFCTITFWLYKRLLDVNRCIYHTASTLTSMKFDSKVKNKPLNWFFFYISCLRKGVMVLCSYNL